MKATRVEVRGIPEQNITEIDYLIQKGYYKTRSHFIRVAVSKLIGNSIEVEKPPVSVEERNFWEETLVLLRKEPTFLKGRYCYYFNNIEKISFTQFKTRLIQYTKGDFNKKDI